MLEHKEEQWLTQGQPLPSGPANCKSLSIWAPAKCLNVLIMVAEPGARPAIRGAISLPVWGGAAVE